jgi:hypothetical protein
MACRENVKRSGVTTLIPMKVNLKTGNIMKMIGRWQVCNVNLENIPVMNKVNLENIPVIYKGYLLTFLSI